MGTLRSLREVLFQVRANYKGSRVESKSSENPKQTLERLLLVVHLNLMHYILRDEGNEEMAANVLLASLRFVGDVPCDKVFFMAGNACKDAGWVGTGQASSSFSALATLPLPLLELAFWL